MMERKIINTDNAPKAIGPYSQAMLVGDTLYISGQLGIDPATGKLVEGGTAEQARQAFENIKAVLAAADMEIILAFLGSVLITVTGLVLPLAYFVNKRFSKYLDHRSGKSMAPQFHVTLRQAMWAGLWAAVCLWLQMNRAFGFAVAMLVAAVLILVEVLLQIRTRTAATT